ncbi:MAG: plasmid pRiA4b ORF-3 family protein [Pyrinomonadaceae bacterium]
MDGDREPVIYQLRVALDGISPLIWRRLLVSGDYSIADLHFILQIAFDWDDWNLHRFFIHGKDYGIYHSGGMSFSDDPYQVKLADFKFRRGEKFLYEYDFFSSWKHLIRIEDILSFDPKKKYPLCTGGGNLSISEAERKATEFAEVEDEISKQLKDKLPAFLKEYQELINFVTAQENAGEAIGAVREKVRRLQEEAAEIKKLNQLLLPATFIRRKLNRHLLHYSQNRGAMTEEDWDEV